MKLLFTGDINFRGKGVVLDEESKSILSEVMPYLDKVAEAKEWSEKIKKLEEMPI